MVFLAVTCQENTTWDVVATNGGVGMLLYMWLTSGVYQ